MTAGSSLCLTSVDLRRTSATMTSDATLTRLRPHWTATLENRECYDEIDLCEALGLDWASYTRAELETLLSGPGEDNDEDREAA